MCGDVCHCVSVRVCVGCVSLCDGVRVCGDTCHYVRCEGVWLHV